jgi:hypothetical protein
MLFLVRELIVFPFQSLCDFCWNSIVSALEAIARHLILRVITMLATNIWRLNTLECFDRSALLERADTESLDLLYLQAEPACLCSCTVLW